MQKTLGRVNGRVPSEALLILGETRFRAVRHRFGLLPDDRLRHLWIIGKTGSGKSTLLSNLIAQDLGRGLGLGVLDPHGDLVETVLAHVPKGRTNDVLLFAPGDADYPISFNVFRRGGDVDRALLASELLSIFRKHWSSSWGPRLEHVLRNGILAVAERPDATLLLLYRYFTDEKLRAKLIPTIQDPVVRAFWSKEFTGYDKALQGEALSPVLNKLGAFLSNPTVRNIVGQERSRVHFDELMSGRGILLANLSTGAIGEDASSLLGSLLLSAAFLAASHRPRGSAPFILYVDEFQRFVTDSIATILSEARKFGLGLTLAHQYLGQLPENIRAAILGNVGSKTVFRVGAEDAATLEREFHPPFTAYDLESLRRYETIVKVLARGEELQPFSATSLPPIPPPRQLSEAAHAIRAASRAQFARPRSRVEAAIASELGSAP